MKPVKKNILTFNEVNTFKIKVTREKLKKEKLISYPGLEHLTLRSNNN